MTFSAVIESLWDTLLKHVPQETAAEIMIDVRNNVISKEKPVVGISVTAEEISKCSKCKNMEQYSRKTATWNTVDPKIVVILERPNIGKESSQLMVKALTEAGFTKENVSLTYLVKCYNYKYSLENRNNCFPYLEDELSALNPDIILSCGKVVTDFLLSPDETLSQTRGNTYRVGDYPVLVTYSPSFIISKDNNTTIKNNFYTDIAAAAKICGVRK